MLSVRGYAGSAISSSITALLGVGFLASCILLGLHVLQADRADLAIVGELLLVAVLSLEGIVAVGHLRQSKLDSLHVLFEVLKDYRSAEMMLALVALWRFRRDHGERFTEAYLEAWHADEEHIATLPGSEQVDAIRGTIHYRRRIVKEFYNSLAGLYELNVLSAKVIYTYWSAAELRIIPEVLIPLETAVANELRTETELGDWCKRLQRLYADSLRDAPEPSSAAISQTSPGPPAFAHSSPHAPRRAR